MLIKLENPECNALKKLANEDILAIHAPQFISSDIATKLSDQIIGYELQNYLNASSIGRIGMASPLTFWS